MFIFTVFVKFFKEMMQDTRAEKAGNSQQGAKFSHLLANFRTSANFRTQLQAHFVSSITFSSELRFG